MLTRGDADAAGQAMREHVEGSMQRALERLEPYFLAHKTQKQAYSLKPRKQFARFQLGADPQTSTEESDVPARV